MSRILLIRHGETDWNSEGRTQGWAPSTLTSRGREQAQELGKYTFQKYNINNIISSDLHRCQETTWLIQHNSESRLNVKWDWRLRERDFGMLQGLPHEIRYGKFPEYFVEKLGEDAIDNQPDSGESLLEFHNRVIECWHEIVDDASDGDVIMVVCHGGTIRSILGHLKGWDLVKLTTEIEQKNCSINEIDASNGKPVVVTENYTVETN